MLRYLTAGLLGLCACMAQSPEHLTLAEAEKRALTRHPAIEAGALEAASVAERTEQAKAARQPFVSAALTAAGAPDNSRIAAGALNNPVIYSRLATGVSVNQMIYDFGRTSHLVESSGASASAAKERTNTTKSDVLLNVRRAYFNALRAQRVLDVARATVDSRQVLADQIGELVKAQLKSSLDLSMVRTNLAEAKLMLSAAQNEQQAAHAALAEAMGEQISKLYDLVDEPVAAVSPVALSEVKTEALTKRPELAAMRFEVESAQSLSAAERSSRMPAISLVGSAGLLPTHVSNLPSDYAAAGVNVTLPFMNGGLYKARQAEAELRARSLQRRLTELQNRIAREVTVAWLDVNNATERVDLSKQYVDQARQALDLAQARYDLGLSSVVELSQAQLTRTNAEIQFASAQYDLQVRRSVLAHAAGEMP